MTKMGAKRTEPRKRMKPISDKQKEKNTLWRLIIHSKILQIIDVFGYPYCQYCGKPEGRHELERFDGHHIDGNRNNNTKENCGIIHRKEHTLLTDRKIKWEDRKIKIEGEN